eukprot:1180318-Karenia_brevis.AAC.1
MFDPPKKGMGRKQNLWVELTVENLEYLRAAVLNSTGTQNEESQTSTPRGWKRKVDDDDTDDDEHDTSGGEEEKEQENENEEPI